MGTYYQFKSKPLRLKKDTPAEIIEFLDARINELDLEHPHPEHELFNEERWDSLFYANTYGKPSFVKEKDYWVLYIHADIKSGIFEILGFANWITPFIAGHKKKEYIGWYIRDDSDDPNPENLYIERDTFEVNNYR